VKIHVKTYADAIGRYTRLVGTTNLDEVKMIRQKYVLSGFSW
jgi:hypothetical protein